MLRLGVKGYWAQSAQMHEQGHYQCQRNGRMVQKSESAAATPSGSRGPRPEGYRRMRDADVASWLHLRQVEQACGKGQHTPGHRIGTRMPIALRPPRQAAWSVLGEI